MLRPELDSLTRQRAQEAVLQSIAATEDYRDGFQWNGKTLFWEYPAQIPNDQHQIDLAEVMDLEDGLIKRHRIYWGWYGVERLKKSIGRSTSPGSQ